MSLHVYRPGRRTSLQLKLAAALLSLAFVAGQVMALDHIHVDDEPVNSCLVCCHADHTPAGTPAVQAAQAQTYRPAAPACPAELFLAGNGAAGRYHCRAPPAA